MAEIRHFISIAAAPEKVYAALTSAQGLKSWWTADSQTETRAGGVAVFGFDKRSTVFRMNIEELEPGKRVVWSCQGDQPEWAGTRLIWELEPDQGRTRVRFIQTNLRSLNDFWASCNSNWGELMFRLKGYAEGKNPGPLWTE